MNNIGFFLQLKYIHTIGGEITHKCVQLHQIGKFYTCVITRTVHALSMNTTHRLHVFYVHFGATIPLTSTV